VSIHGLSTLLEKVMKSGTRIFLHVCYQKIWLKFVEIEDL
jgi:hypothetical protein